MSKDSHRVGSGRNCGEPFARLRNSGASGHNQAHFFCGLDDPLWLCRERYVLVRISSKCRCAKCEREHGTCTSDRPAAHATEFASCFHILIVSPSRILASLFRVTLGQKHDTFGHRRSVRPKKMFQTQLVKTGFCFFASVGSGRSEFFINSGGRFPL